MESASHRPLELILARNLLSSLSTPGMLVNQPGDVVFFNEAAGAVIGRRFEETGALPAAEWIKTYGPFDLSGEPIPLEDQPLTKALRSNRPGHTVQSLRSTSGETHQIEVSGFPIIGSDGFQGAIIFFWPAGEAVA